MIFLLPFIILYFGIKSIREHAKKGWEYNEPVFATILLSVFAWVLIGLFSFGLIIETKIENKVFDIVQLRQSSSMSISGGGSFLGWSITGEGTQQYVIMEKYENGTMKRRFLDQSRTYIVETDEQPRVEYRQTQNRYLYALHFPTLWDNIDRQYYLDNAIIYIPTGTVIQEFERM